jgi:transcriptional regulator with XRE-family HTH domain
MGAKKANSSPRARGIFADMPTDQFAALIAGLKSSGLSRAEIAMRSGVSASTIWRALNGQGGDHLSSTVQRVERLHERIVGKPSGLRVFSRGW